VLRQYEFFSLETFSLLAVLLSLPLPEGQDLSLPLTPQKQRQKTLETLVTWLLKAAGQKPVVLVIEDLQWADPSTLELLSLLIDQILTARIFVLQTFRPEFSPLWTGRSPVAH
jgi:predicted ATPase